MRADEAENCELYFAYDVMYSAKTSFLSIKDVLRFLVKYVVFFDKYY